MSRFMSGVAGFTGGLAMALAGCPTPVTAADVWGESDATYPLRQYKPNYFLPGYWSDDPEMSGDTWAKWQVSFSYPILDVRRKHVPDGKPVIAYTVEAWWRLYEESAPFDEFDHNPEAFYEGVWHFKGRKVGLRAGWEHQSTGVASDSSRSWNRIFVEAKYRWRGFNLYARPWWVANVGENSEGIKDAADFGGSSFGGKLIIVYKTDRSRDAVTLYSGGRIELEVTYRFFSENLYVYGQYSNGRMESLIDFATYQNAGGIGMALMK